MKKLGVWLRQTREAKGSTLEEVEAATRIRPQFLEMLEAGDFAALPGGEVQVRGFLTIYARYLDLSPDEVLARYQAEVHGVERVVSETPAEETSSDSPEDTADDLTSRQFRPRDIPVSSSLPRWMSFETLLAVGIALIALLAALALVSYLMTRDTGARSVPAVTTTPEETMLPPTATPTPPSVAPTLPANPEGEVRLTLEATEHVWVRVRRDTKTAFEGMMAPGQTETWSSQEAIAVETGNGAGLQVTVNGQALGAMCGRGEVCSRAWGPDGEVDATSSSTP